MTAPTVAELAKVPMFAALVPADLEEMAKRFTIRHRPKGAIVANAGDRLDLFNVILSGTIQWFWRDDADHLLKRTAEGPGTFVPLARAGEAQDIADGVLFLASSASGYMTGAELVIDGGMFGGGMRR